jgi:hypothetical protein
MGRTRCTFYGGEFGTLNYPGLRTVIGGILQLGILFSMFTSCKGSSCEIEKQYYGETWDYIIEKTYKDAQHKATYVILTTQGRELYFQPVQDIVFFASKGDRIIKDPNSKYANLVTQIGDSIRYSIYSVTCDSIIENPILQEKG